MPNLDSLIHALYISTFLNVQSVNETVCSFKVGHCTVGDILRWCCGTFLGENESVVFIKLDCIYSFPLGEAKSGASLSGAAGSSLPARPRETCARSWAPSVEGTGSAAPEAPRSSPQTSGCRSRGDRSSHPPAAPSLSSTQEQERRGMERRQEKVEAKGAEDSLL